MPEIKTRTQQTIDMARKVIGNRTLAENIELRQELMEKSEERIAFTTNVREIIEYSRPDLSKYIDDTQRKGEKRTGSMYTSKVTTDIETAADAFVGNVFNPGNSVFFFQK